MNVKILLITLMVLFVSSGCVSILDKDKIDGLQEMAVWKDKGERLAKESPKCKKDYNDARAQIKAYIFTLDTEIEQLETQYFSKIDLSKNKIPPEVSKSVSTFLDCATNKEPFSNKTLLPLALAFRPVAKDVRDWCDAQIKEARKNSAKALKEKIKTLVWEEWETVKK